MPRFLSTAGRRLRGRAADERGTVILLVAAMLTGILAFGAYTIDIGSGRQAEAKAQSGSDATAEAVAAQISSDEQNGTTPTYSELETVADQVASANGYANPSVTVTWPYNGSNTLVKVTVQSAADTSVGKESGANTIPVMASAIASVNFSTSTSTSTVTTVSSNTTKTTSSTPVTRTSTQTVTGTTTSTSTKSDLSCATAGNSCMAIFAMQTGCSTTGVTFGGGSTISGGAWSNSSLNIGGGGSNFQALSYASGCSVTPAAGIEASQNYQGNSFNQGLPQAQSPLTSWPLNYAADFPSCSGSGCTGVCADNNNTTAAGTDSSCATSLKTPSYCTQASTKSSWSIDTYSPPYTLITGQVYCAVGSGTPSNPATWNGALSVAGGSSSMKSTFVAASISVGGGTTLASCGDNLPYFSSSTCSAPTPSTPNYPLFYAISGTINASSGGNGMSGDWFAPNGAISVGGGTSFIGFLEAQTVNLSSGGITGDGPADDGSSIGSTQTVTTTSTTSSVVTSTTVTTSTSTGTMTNYTTSTSYPTTVTSTPNGSKLTG
jgi:Flp pilus assembly protein TadG